MSVNHPKELLLSDGSLPQLYLPSPPSEPIPSCVQEYTIKILHILGLRQYDFLWATFTSELGMCVQNSHIAISCYFYDNPTPRVWKVVLHEIAHALEFELYGQGEHGESWVRCGEAIGLYENAPIVGNGTAPYPSAELLLQTMLDVYYE